MDGAELTITEPQEATRSPAVPRVGVVLLICRAEEEDFTIDCIDSLQRAGYPALEIILVDNGSPVETGERLARRLRDVRSIRLGSNMGFTGGNNRGIAQALESGCDYVWVLNNDTEVEADCLSRLIRLAEQEENVGCVGGKILHFDRPDRVWFGGGTLSRLRAIGKHRGAGAMDDISEDSPEEVTFLTGCSMLLPADVLRTVGCFEEDFFIYLEDVEMSMRLRAAGYRLLYDPRARLYHKVSLPEPALPPHKILLRDRNRRRIVRRRYRMRERMMFALFFYPSRLIHALRYLLRGDWGRAGAIWRGMVVD